MEVTEEADRAGRYRIETISCQGCQSVQLPAQMLWDSLLLVQSCPAASCPCQEAP